MASQPSAPVGSQGEQAVPEATRAGRIAAGVAWLQALVLGASLVVGAFLVIVGFSLWQEHTFATGLFGTFAVGWGFILLSAFVLPTVWFGTLGILLWRGRPWARWAAVLSSVVAIIGPPIVLVVASESNLAEALRMAGTVNVPSMALLIVAGGWETTTSANDRSSTPTT